MKTKIIILGDAPHKRAKKPIQFTKYIDQFGRIEETCVTPSKYDTIELVSKDYGKDLDIMFAFNGENRSEGVLYLGHFNDGIV